MANNFQELSDSIIGLLGGKENISSSTYCMTRLRFNIKDKSKVDETEVNKLSGVVGTQWQNEQFQVIIGQGVEQAYKMIAQKNDFDTSEIPEGGKEDKEDKPRKKFSIGAVIDVITSSITEVLPVLIGAGMINVVLILLNSFQLIQPEGPTDTTLTFVSDAAFYFLPIYVGASSAKKFDMNIYLGMFFGAVLVHPTFTDLIAEGTPGAIFGLPIYGATYTSSIFPVILTNFVASYFYKWIEKKGPEALKSMLVPLFTILITAPLMLVILAPLGAIIGDGLTMILVWIYETIGFLGLGLLGLVFPWLIITGMHHSFGPYLFQGLAQNGHEAMLFPLTYINNINQGVASFAVSLKSKDKKIKGTAASTAIPAIFAGVTEPALFGVNLKYRTPLYSTMIGNFVGLCIAGFFEVAGYAFVGSFGILGLPAFVGEDPSNLIYMIIAIIVSVIVTFITAFILYKDK